MKYILSLSFITDNTGSFSSVVASSPGVWLMCGRSEINPHQSPGDFSNLNKSSVDIRLNISLSLYMWN